MNLRHILLGALFMGSVLVLNGVLALPNGITGHSGAASDGGASCGNCHIVSSTEKVNNFYISHNIPTTGYIPNTRYDFTLKMKSKLPRAGFNIKIENSQGLVAGTIVSTDTVLSRTENGELVHTYYSNINEGEGTFNFSWTAPSEEMDTINMYGAVATLPRNGTIDTLNFIRLTLKPDLTTAIRDRAYTATEIISQIDGKDQIDIKYDLKTSSEVRISVFNGVGLLIRDVKLGTIATGNLNYSFPKTDLPKGLCIVSLFINSKPISQKIFID
jgi:hypothetical protein